MNKQTFDSVKNLEIFAPFVNRLAEISAKSTLKFLEQKDGREMIHDLRINIAHDCRYLEGFARHLEEDEITEKTYAEAKEERKLINREISMISAKMRKMLKMVTYDENEYEALNDMLADAEAERERVSSYIKKSFDYLQMMQNEVYSKSLSENGYDIVNIAKRSILSALHRSANAPHIIKLIHQYNEDYTLYTTDEFKAKVLQELLDSVKHIPVAIKHYKTKKGYQVFNLKSFADANCRLYINKSRSGIATKTMYLIQGYDEEGHEILVQSDKMLTAGGISDIFRADEFRDFMKSLNLTEQEKELAYLLMKGKTHEEIGKRFNVSRQAIEKRITKLQARLNQYEEVQNRMRYHNGTK